jgi:hypothetical protein
LDFIDNVDWLVDAKCGGGGNVIMSMMLLPRLLLGSVLWTVIWAVPTYMRPTTFDVFYYVIYDYGGKGFTFNLWADIFCFIVNLYYWVLIVAAFFVLYLLDNTVFTLYRQMLTNARLGRASVETALVKEELDDLKREIYNRESEESQIVLGRQHKNNDLRYRK